MPFKLDLMANERLIINGAALRNGPRRTTMLIETNARFLREADIITEADADTPAKKIYTTLMVIHLADQPADAIHLLYGQFSEFLAILPGAAEHVIAIRDAVDSGRFYPALKAGRALIHYEQTERAKAA